MRQTQGHQPNAVLEGPQAPAQARHRPAPTVWARIEVNCFEDLTTAAVQFWQPKTRRNRVVPISSALRAWLDRWTPPKSDQGWYFPSPEDKRYDPDNFSQDLRAAQVNANLPYASCLDFRHTFGSQLAMKGESLYKIATLMGNSPEICRRHYAALVPEAMTDTVEFPKTEPTAPTLAVLHH